MVNKLYKLHMEKAHGETVTNDPFEARQHSLY